jgi:nicotinate-nucleotide--dimethylbenzimidazole phosphoribosyltransferase
MNENELYEIIKAIRPADAGASARAEARQAKLAKPPRSLGKLEDISVRLAGITGKVKSEIKDCRVLVFAADNGVYEEGVAVTPQIVTLAQAINMPLHKTGMSVLANHFGDSIAVYDVGINASGEIPGVMGRKVRRSTGNIRMGPAMTRKECVKAIGVGIEAVETAARDGMSAVGVGEMGIANTTTSAAVLSCLTGIEPARVTGRGAGLSDEAFFNKIKVISDAIAVNEPKAGDALDVLSKVGGLDIAAMTGAYIGAAYYRVPAVVDGFISIVAALAAVRLAPPVRDHLFLSHASKETGYRVAAEALGLEPFLLLDMRLGEGSGCPLAFQIMRAACAVMRDMATFEEAAIDDSYLDSIRGFDAFKQS